MSTGVARPARAAAALALALLGVTSPARAQFQPRPLPDDEVVGENYHVEGAFGLWSPAPQISISSESLGILGTTIDFGNDLGLQSHSFPEFHFELRGGKHKLRIQAIPISYQQSATLTRNIVFNGQLYSIGIPVTSSVDWRAWRFGYEYDALRRDRYYAGVVVDFKYSDVYATLTSPLTSEFVQAQAPIPAIGGAGRVYVLRNLAIYGEFTGASLGWLPPPIVKNNQGHYWDYDIYGTWNFTNAIGVQVGYRSLDLGYIVNQDRDSGSLTLRGLFFGVVARY